MSPSSFHTFVHHYLLYCYVYNDTSDCCFSHYLFHSLCVNKEHVISPAGNIFLGKLVGKPDNNKNNITGIDHNITSCFPLEIVSSLPDGFKDLINNYIFIVYFILTGFKNGEFRIPYYSLSLRKLLAITCRSLGRCWEKLQPPHRWATTRLDRWATITKILPDRPLKNTYERWCLKRTSWNLGFLCSEFRCEVCWFFVWSWNWVVPMFLEYELYRYSKFGKHHPFPSHWLFNMDFQKWGTQRNRTQAQKCSHSLEQSS